MTRRADHQASKAPAPSGPAGGVGHLNGRYAMPHDDARVAPAVPLNVPPRSELWARVQLAKSLLNHRPAGHDTTLAVLAVLEGKEIRCGS